MKKNPDQFLFPEEEVLQENIRGLDDVILSSALMKIGFFKKSIPIAEQAMRWGVPIYEQVPLGRGFVYLFKKSDLVMALGVSRLLPLRILLFACGVRHGDAMMKFTVGIRRQGVEIHSGAASFVARADAIRIYQEHLKTKSGGSAVKPDRDPPGQQNSLNPAPPESVGADHLRRVTEALLLFAQYSKDLMERCESLLEKVSDDFETQKKANRVLFKMADEHKMALKKIMASFEISTE